MIGKLKWRIIKFSINLLPEILCIFMPFFLRVMWVFVCFVLCFFIKVCCHVPWRCENKLKCHYWYTNELHGLKSITYYYVWGRGLYGSWICNYMFVPMQLVPITIKVMTPPPRGCAGGRIGTRFLRPRGTSPLKGVNPAGTLGYRNGTKSFFGLKGRPSVVQDV
jgi:hypothetical protein